MARVENHGSAKPIKAALYLDFDNVFLALQRLDKKAAHRFAKEPLSWLKWFEDGGHEMTIATSENAEERRILVRRCYLNPSAFSRYRPYFTRNGFMVIDCPALTSQGKNSADIYMVMDILDALSHETRFDEFIILSSDADFTPILTRLREHDRRSTIISNAMAAAALKSACDYAVPENTFIEEALEPETIEQASAPPQDNRVARRGAPSAGRVAPSESEPGTQPKLMTDGSSATLVSQVVQFARGSLERSSRPVLVSTLGHHLSSAVRNALRENKYCGHRSLTRLLKTADGDRMSTVVAGPESYVYDPTRHQPLPTRTEQEDAEEFANLSPDMVTFIGRIHEVVGLPRLSPQSYEKIFQALVELLKQEEFSGELDLSRRVRDVCQKEGNPISRANVAFVIKGLHSRGTISRILATTGRKQHALFVKTRCVWLEMRDWSSLPRKNECCANGLPAMRRRRSNPRNWPRRQ